jgi:hypothetical protein
MMFSRRFVVGGLVGSAALSAAHGPAWAKAALSGHQVTGAYRHAVGSFEVIALNDGMLEIPVGMLLGADPAEAGKLLSGRSLPADKSPTAVNAFLVNTGDKLVLIDSGTGSLMGPSMGRFAANLAAFGVDPASVVFPGSATSLRPARSTRTSRCSGRRADRTSYKVGITGLQKSCGQLLGEIRPPLVFIEDFYSEAAYPRVFPTEGRLSTRSHSSRETTWA